MTSAEGRRAHIGTDIECRICESRPSVGQERRADWAKPGMVDWCRLLLDSFRHWTGRELIARLEPPEAQARALFYAPCVVVSHGAEADPLLNYGNQAALELWETDWATLTRTLSRVTAEPANRAERERMLDRAARQGCIEDYRGVRISLRGRRFLVENAVVWNVIDAELVRHGQAATFSRWTFL